jgi:hypothetical protein
VKAQTSACHRDGRFASDCFYSDIVDILAWYELPKDIENILILPPVASHHNKKHNGTKLAIPDVKSQNGNFFSFLLGYICTEGIYFDNFEKAYIVHWLNHSHNPPPTTPSLPHLKQLQEVSLFYFIYVYEVHQLYSLTFISSTPPTASSLQSHFLLLIPVNCSKGFLNVPPL